MPRKPMWLNLNDCQTVRRKLKKGLKMHISCFRWWFIFCLHFDEFFGRSLVLWKISTLLVSLCEKEFFFFSSSWLLLNTMYCRFQLAIIRSSVYCFRKMDTFTGSSVKALEMVQLSHIVLNFRLFVQIGFIQIYVFKTIQRCR